MSLNMFRIETKLRAQPGTIAGVNCAVMITNRAGIIVWVNRAFTTMTGFTEAEAIGRNPGALINSGEQGPSFYRDLWATILKGRTWRGEMINRRKDGSLYAEAQTISPVDDSAGDITHFVAFKRDLTAEGVAVAMPKPAEEKGAKAIGLETILVVEDDAERRSLATATLRSAGYRVLAAASEANALALLDAHRGRLDLLFTDQVLTGPGASQPVGQVLAARPEIDVLYNSGYTAHRLFERDGRDHVAHSIRPAYTPSELVRKVRDVLDLRQRPQVA
jgi:PAS domain S-box-containing protein